MGSQLSRVNFLDYSVFATPLTTISFSQKKLINTLNQYSFCIAQTDSDFEKALKESDILLPDGIAIVAAVKILSKQKIKKITGADLHDYLLIELNKNAGKCFYLGSSENTLLKIRERISKEFPDIKLQTFSPPYKPEFSDVENRQIVEAVNTFNPDVLFIGMTAPKQEKWAFKHKELLDAKIICSIGAVFDFYSGTVNRPHTFWINLGLEWLIRLVKEPKRMWKRYLYYGPVFIKLIFLEKFKQVFKTVPKIF